MLWVYDQYKYFTLSVRRCKSQILTSKGGTRAESINGNHDYTAMQSQNKHLLTLQVSNRFDLFLERETRE